ncbi:MAG: hypothetical protein U0797_03115 [Gemmataceae bacterium]
MSQVVQAACPGCKSVLRIPSGWIGQPIRCKNCNTVLKAKPPAAPSPGLGRVVAPASPEPAVVPQPALIATPAGLSSPFAFDELGDDLVDSSARPGRRRRRSGSWLGLVTAVVILGLTGGTGYYVFTQIIQPRQEAAASGEQEEGESRRRKAKGADGPASFPRRALLISVHNYLYANPISEGGPDAPNMERLRNSLNRGLRIPLDQILHLSDAARKEPRPPLKSVIEQALSNFLQTSRKQDRVLVAFVGHTKEIDNEPYLVPLDGELDNAATLIPLKWVYQQLEKCPARQKVLVLDGNRFNAGQGEERPSSGPMTEKFEAALKAPPAGVQVWSACSAGQQSNEFEESSLGLFLDSLRLALTPENTAKGALDGKIQKPDDLLPLEPLHAFVNERMAHQAERRKAGKQVSLLAGKPRDDGAEFDRTEGPAQAPALPPPPAGDLTLVQAIMAEISVPPLKGGESNSQDVPFALLPRFPQEVLKRYQQGDLPADSKLRQAAHKARVALWAVSTAKPPKELADDVAQARKAMRFDLSVMRERYGIPPAAGVEAFKASVVNDLEPMARIIKKMEDVLDDLRAVGEEREAAPKRWQANYDFLLARCQATLAYLEEYQGQLGQMRRELPEHDANIHSGFRLASTEKATDVSGKKLERAARKLFTDLAKENPNTPWEVLAKRERLTALGLVWKAY